MHVTMKLGLCCINTVLRQHDIFNSRTCRLPTFNSKGYEYVSTLIQRNVADIIPMMLWNELHGIKVFRLSSEIFPHYTNPSAEYTYDLADYSDTLLYAGNLAKLFGHRINFHPGHFNIIGAKDPTILENTIKDLGMHANILDLMECDLNSTMVVHGGATYGNKKDTMDRWIRNYRNLPDYIQRRLVLENCEKCFSIEDCIYISQCLNFELPVVFDIHHYHCYSLLHPTVKQQSLSELMPQILNTWKYRDISPEFHISEQGSGKIGHHSDYISSIPDIFWETAAHTSFALMVEAKMKEQAILQLYSLYPSLLPKDYTPHPFIEEFKSIYPIVFN